MSYGASVEAPIVYDEAPPYRNYRPDMAEMPVMSAADVATMRRRNTISKQLPAMPASSMGDLSFTNYDQVKAFQDMQALAVGQGDRKYAERVNRNQAKAEETELENYNRKASKNNNARQAYKRSEYGKAVDKNAVNRIAQGIGALHVLYPIR